MNAWIKNNWMGVILIVVFLAAICVGIYVVGPYLVDLFVVTTVPAIEPTGEPAPAAQPAVEEPQAEENGDIVIAQEGYALVPAGYSLAGDVQVAESDTGPWITLYDDKAETGLVVTFSKATWVQSPWGQVIATVIDPQKLIASAKENGCGLPGGCPEVALVNWPKETEGYSASGPVATPVVTPKPGQWVLAVPPVPEELPTMLWGEQILYRQPPVDCAIANDPNVTCSTREGQPTSGGFTLHDGEAILMTGDAIDIGEGGHVLARRPYDGSSVHDLWLVLNLAGEDWNLAMNAPYGSFRGYFSAPGGWTPELVSHLRDLHLYLFNLPTQTWERFYPTPVPNCGSPEGCPFVNVRVGINFGNGTLQWFNGYWDEVATPHWVPVQ